MKDTCPVHSNSSQKVLPCSSHTLKYSSRFYQGRWYAPFLNFLLLPWKQPKETTFDHFPPQCIWKYSPSEKLLDVTPNWEGADLPDCWHYQTISWLTRNTLHLETPIPYITKKRWNINKLSAASRHKSQDFIIQRTACVWFEEIVKGRQL